MVNDKARLRVAIVGSGSWARTAHLPAFANHPRTKLVAIVGVDSAELERAARDFNCGRTFDSVEVMIRTASPDVISIVTPDDVHVEPARLAISAGIPVICEKPLAVTISEAAQLAEFARSSNIPTKVGFSLRYAPAVRWLQELLVRGELG